MSVTEVEAASWLAVFEEKVERLQQNFRDCVAFYRGRIDTLTQERDRARELLASTEAQVRSLVFERDKLATFKRYVHSQLDTMCVPADPHPTQTKLTGCRISGRLEFMRDQYVKSTDVLSDRGVGAGEHISAMAKAAKFLGYKKFAWNGRLYEQSATDGSFYDTTAKGALTL